MAMALVLQGIGPGVNGIADVMESVDIADLRYGFSSSESLVSS